MMAQPSDFAVRDGFEVVLWSCPFSPSALDSLGVQSRALLTWTSINIYPGTLVFPKVFVDDGTDDESALNIFFQLLR